MTPQEFGLLFLSIISSMGGQFFLKVGALKLGKVSFENAISHIFNIILIPELLGGLAFYGFGAIAYILLLTRVNLSVAAPAASIMYIFSVLLGYFAFREPIPISRSIGLGFIILGVALVIWEK